MSVLVDPWKKVGQKISDRERERGQRRQFVIGILYNHIHYPMSTFAVFGSPVGTVWSNNKNTIQPLPST